MMSKDADPSYTNERQHNAKSITGKVLWIQTLSKRFHKFVIELLKNLHNRSTVKSSNSRIVNGLFKLSAILALSFVGQVNAEMLFAAPDTRIAHQETRYGDSDTTLYLIKGVSIILDSTSQAHKGISSTKWMWMERPQEAMGASCQTPISMESFEACIGALHKRLEQAGYPLSVIAVASATPEDLHIAIELKIEPGQAATFDSVHVEGVPTETVSNLRKWVVLSGDHTASLEQVERLRRRLEDHPGIRSVDWSGWIEKSHSAGEAEMNTSDPQPDKVISPVYRIEGLTQSRLDGLLGWNPNAGENGGIVGSLDLLIPSLKYGTRLDLSFRRMNPLHTSLDVSLLKGWRRGMDVDLAANVQLYQQDSLYFDRRIGVMGYTALSEGVRIFGTVNQQRILSGRGSAVEFSSKGWSQGGGFILESVRKVGDGAGTLIRLAGSPYGLTGIPSLDEGWLMHRGWGVILHGERTERLSDRDDQLGNVNLNRWSVQSKVLLPLSANTITWNLMVSGTFVTVQNQQSSQSTADLLRIGGDPGFRGTLQDQYRGDRIAKGDVEIRRKLADELTLFGFTTFGRIRQVLTYDQLGVDGTDANSSAASEIGASRVINFSPARVDEAGAAIQKEPSLDLFSLGIGLTTVTPVGRWIVTYAVLASESWTTGSLHLRIRGDF